MSENIFEKASRVKLRFSSAKGLLSVEELWDFPLSHSLKGNSLDSIAIDLYEKLSNTSRISFVNNTPKEASYTQLRFDIVKHIIDIRLAREAAELTALENKNKKQQILALINQKENEALGNQSLEDLKKLADSL